MMSMVKKLIIVFILISISFKSFCQEMDTSKILGSWVCDKLEFLTTMPDSSNIIKNAKGSIVTFIVGNKFTSKSLVNGILKEENGSYSIDGKYLIQNEDRAEIISLNDKEFVLKISKVVIFYFLRKEDSK